MAASCLCRLALSPAGASLPPRPPSSSMGTRALRCPPCCAARRRWRPRAGACAQARRARTA
eukprot:965792-Pleurochrysis_carterae.AAC.1